MKLPAWYMDKGGHRYQKSNGRWRCTWCGCATPLSPTERTSRYRSGQVSLVLVCLDRQGYLFYGRGRLKGNVGWSRELTWARRFQ